MITQIQYEANGSDEDEGGIICSNASHCHGETAVTSGHVPRVGEEITFQITFGLDWPHRSETCKYWNGRKGRVVEIIHRLSIEGKGEQVAVHYIHVIVEEVKEDKDERPT